MQTEADNKCRLCEPFNETVDHIISACPIIAKETPHKETWLESVYSTLL